jgi:hypothetical protein
MPVKKANVARRWSLLSRDEGKIESDKEDQHWSENERAVYPEL